MFSETLAVKQVTNITVPLVSFANGSISEACRRQLSVGVYEESKHAGRGRKRKIVMAESGKKIYKGSNFHSNDAKSDATELYLAEVNRETGEMRVYPAEVFNLTPVGETSILEQSLKEGMSFREKSDILTDAFGSGKQKKALARRQQNQLKESAMTSAISSVVDSAVAAQQLSGSPALPMTSSAIPPCNLDARTPGEVYRLEDIIGQAELQSLRNVAEVFFKSDKTSIKEWQEKNVYFPSILSRLSLMPLNETARWHRACCLMYLQYMMIFFQVKAAHIQKKDPLPEEWPDMVKDLLLSRFTVRSDAAKRKRCTPARLKDLLLSHILVMCLILDHFTTSLQPLQMDLKIAATKLQTHARSLGCRVKKDTSNIQKEPSYTAVLTVPLTFPEPIKRRGK